MILSCRWEDGLDIETITDLCSIYTTAGYIIGLAMSQCLENLRGRIYEMNRLDLTPLEYRQQIQSHPGNMLVTALNKQRYTRQISLSFSAELLQLTCFDLSDKGRLSQIVTSGI